MTNFEDPIAAHCLLMMQAFALRNSLDYASTLAWSESLSIAARHGDANGPLNMQTLHRVAIERLLLLNKLSWCRGEDRDHPFVEYRDREVLFKLGERFSREFYERSVVDMERTLVEIREQCGEDVAALSTRDWVWEAIQMGSEKMLDFLFQHDFQFGQRCDNGGHHSKLASLALTLTTKPQLQMLRHVIELKRVTVQQLCLLPLACCAPDHLATSVLYQFIQTLPEFTRLLEFRQMLTAPSSTTPTVALLQPPPSSSQEKELPKEVSTTVDQPDSTTPFDFGGDDDNNDGDAEDWQQRKKVQRVYTRSRSSITKDTKEKKKNNNDDDNASFDLAESSESSDRGLEEMVRRTRPTYRDEEDSFVVEDHRSPAASESEMSETSKLRAEKKRQQPVVNNKRKREVDIDVDESEDDDAVVEDDDDDDDADDDEEIALEEPSPPTSASAIAAANRSQQRRAAATAASMAKNRLIVVSAADSILEHGPLAFDFPEVALFLNNKIDKRFLKDVEHMLQQPWDEWPQCAAYKLILSQIKGVLSGIGADGAADERMWLLARLALAGRLEMCSYSKDAIRRPGGICCLCRKTRCTVLRATICVNIRNVSFESDCRRNGIIDESQGFMYAGANCGARFAEIGRVLFLLNMAYFMSRRMSARALDVGQVLLGALEDAKMTMHQSRRRDADLSVPRYVGWWDGDAPGFICYALRSHP